jgi:hypothetical protein
MDAELKNLCRTVRANRSVSRVRPFGEAVGEGELGRADVPAEAEGIPDSQVKFPRSGRRDLR